MEKMVEEEAALGPDAAINSITAINNQTNEYFIWRLFEHDDDNNNNDNNNNI